jgi:predicted ATPase
MATTIKIRNIGPIKEADLDLNKINVFMGQQSSGKSTVAKIISYCQWVEKRYLLDNEFEYSVETQLLDFHHLDKNYFGENSLFKYESDFISISYSTENLKQEISVNNDKIENYQKTKNIYIPAERCIVSVIPDLKKYREKYDNIFELLSDWDTAKKNFTKNHKFPILNLGISYYFDKDAQKDILFIQNSKKEIAFNLSSSGLQAITPLIVILENLIKNIYENVDINKYRANPVERTALDNVFFKLNNSSRKSNKDSDAYKELERKRFLYHFTQFIIEEPEQNLFPETQRDLIYYILEKLNSEKNHSLTITTHSPYILYALNNCMLGGLVGNKMKEADKEKLNCKNSFINPQNISIYEIHDGILKSIQQNDSLISKNYFDANMKDLMDDFYVMLNYYGK